LDPVVPLHIKTYIQPVIIWDSKFISITVKNIICPIKTVFSYWESHRSPCLIYKIGRQTKSFCQLIISHQTKVVGLVKIGRKKSSVIYSFIPKFTIQFQKRSG